MNTKPKLHVVTAPDFIGQIVSRPGVVIVDVAQEQLTTDGQPQNIHADVRLPVAVARRFFEEGLRAVMAAEASAEVAL